MGQHGEASESISGPAVIGTVCSVVLTIAVSVTVCICRCHRRKLLRETSFGSSSSSQSLPNNGRRTDSSSPRSTISDPSKRMSPVSPAIPILPQSFSMPLPQTKTYIKTSSSDTLSIDPGLVSTDYCIENEVNQRSPRLDAMENKLDQIRERMETVPPPSTLGTLNFSVGYDMHKSAFRVTIHKANDLPIRDPQSGSADPYIKLCLLPDKKHKVKTRVLRRTRNPVFEETFTFFGLERGQLPGISLHFSVLSFDRFSRDHLIGEVTMSLAKVDMTEGEVTMTGEIVGKQTKQQQKPSGKGEILVSLCYQPAANRLSVVILKARNLTGYNLMGPADPFVKLCLLQGDQKLAKKKTHVKRHTANPVFNESFIFDVPSEGLEDITVELQVLDHDRVSKNDQIGRLTFGGRAKTPSTLEHWKEVCENPRRQIAKWHDLQQGH
ncbi:synaptotagmin-4-like [Branchiostoma floridae]|uniref:Synaptotagmin-4-like n=1 Tax=Branchiostoma floridae TaxID=7739 RepID=A0A9J7MFP3_BRAFL|nr:synaptotagmin-4-like [Branchiostoma floridae]